MKITIERKSFIEAIMIGGSMSGKAKTLPILDMAKVSIKDKKATISSFDGECAITLRSAIIDNEGEIVFCINTRDLSLILKSLKDETLEMNIDNNICTIVHSKGKLELPTCDSADFPTPSKEDENGSIALNGGLLAKWVRNSKSFVEQNGLRPAMSGMYLYVEGNEIGCAATNAHKLYWDYINSNDVNCDNKLDAIITSKGMDALLGMIKSDDDVTISFSNTNIIFKTKNAMLLCRKIDGKFPSFKTIIPKDSAIRCEVEINTLKDAIMRANLMSGMTHLLKFTIGGLNMHIESCDFDFGKKNSEDVMCSVEGDEITIAFNGVYLLDCINVLSLDNAHIEMSTYTRPILFREENATLLLMPMKFS